VAGITREIMAEALEQARRARTHVLKKMSEALDKPRPELSKYAPRIYLLHVPQDRVRNLIGPGGKHIQKIIAETGVKIDIEEPGKVHIISNDAKSAEKAIKLVRAYTHQAEVGKYYIGKVKWIEDDFGAMVEIFPGTIGLLHISQIDNRRINKVSDVLKEGDEVLVKVLAVDPQGRIRLSRKAALKVSPDKAVKFDID
ncbi:MAG TPA: S1 RNA-binding domain-containing protein, partial [Proteobacteria bacterium]|nr:S1 RNA-binding domain-containing protein [Pseudomonadota bacterium]